MTSATPPRVVHRDAELLIVEKPAGVPTTAPDGGDCLVRRVEVLDPDAPRLHPTSRLDADVSGLVTFARTPRATRALLEARKAGRYGRLYLGLAARAPEADEGAWEWSIGIDPRDRRRRLAGAGRAQKAARTRFVVCSRVDAAVLLELYPQTGRTHQLRVHAAAAGLPLLGDKVYGGGRRLVLPDGRVVGAPRVMLHCARLALPDVAAGGTLALVSPPPGDFTRAWTGAGGAPDVLSGAFEESGPT